MRQPGCPARRQLRQPVLTMAPQKKQVPLRLNAKLYAQLAAWAEDDFRSLNGQIEYLLTEAVRKRRSARGLPEEFDEEEE